jgi:hypothetical protein
VAAKPVIVFAVDLDRAPAPCRRCGFVVLALSLASWAAVFAGAEILLRLLF